MATRSFIVMLGQVGAQIEVPADDVWAGRTIATPASDDPNVRPLIRIHSGTTQPANAYAFINYRDTWFWVDDTDYPSKAAFSILELARNVVDSGHTPRSPIIAISAE